ncbi:MAG TPA: hypothetical protein VFB33_12210 [Candidatus Binataceae bacterium]|nr:hypothetical protein [Candidatus Binataceae bacterium]
MAVPIVCAAMATLFVVGCGAAEMRSLQPPAAPAASARGTSGFWQGTSTAGCQPLQPEARRCNATVKITLHIVQQGSALSGTYTCAAGTMVCRESNTSGVIANGREREGGGIGLRVMMPDGSSCLFNGRRADDAMAGTYFCMQGGGYIEQGRFSVERAY